MIKNCGPHPLHLPHILDTVMSRVVMSTKSIVGIWTLACTSIKNLKHYTILLFYFIHRTLLSELDRLKVLRKEDQSKVDSAGYSDERTRSPGRDTELVAEAKLLRQHKGRLEARMQILEDHNRQLEAQLQRLRQLLEQVRAFIIPCEHGKHY